MAARLVPEKREEYLELHRDVWPRVEATITECGIRNFTIFVLGDVLFGYYEYVGDDYEADQARMARGSGDAGVVGAHGPVPAAVRAGLTARRTGSSSTRPGTSTEVD